MVVYSVIDSVVLVLVFHVIVYSVKAYTVLLIFHGCVTAKRVIGVLFSFIHLLLGSLE